MPRHSRLKLYWHTVRHLRFSQVIARSTLRTRAAVRQVAPAAARAWYSSRAAHAGLTFSPDPWLLRGAAAAAVAVLAPDTIERSRREAADACTGTFGFLRERRTLGCPIDWTAPGAAQLWRYHLHYFDFLPDILVGGSMPAGFALMADWIRRVPLGNGGAARDAWHPYVVSVRLVNWMLGIAAAPRDVEVPEAILDSLRLQTLFVRGNLETDVGGNHLLKNLKALAMAGCFWQGGPARELRERFTAEFVRELGRQLRSDGGHYEQSPMYHAQVLGDAIELALVLRRMEFRDRDLDSHLQRMVEFLAGVVHPDGQLVQFGDTAAGMTPDPDALFAAAAVLRARDPGQRLVSRHALLSSYLIQHRNGQSNAAARVEVRSPATTPAVPQDWWDPRGSGFLSLVTANGNGFLIADAGPVCPDDLPAHAHSDTFGFELSLDASRIVVDSGVAEYAAGEWRDYYRSTRAHNTVMVDGVEQSECWGSFRVARRARIMDGRVEQLPHATGFSAAHNGFEHLRAPVTHRRRFLLIAERCWIVIDELTGSGAHTWETFLHLHPEVELERGPSGYIASRGGVRLGVAWFGIAEPQRVKGERSPLQGWYAPAFGHVLASPTLVGRGSGTLPARLGWLLVPHPATGQPFQASSSDAAHLVVEIGRDRYELNVGDPQKELVCPGGRKLAGL